MAADFAQLEAMIEQTVDMSNADQHEFNINPAFSSELGELHEQKEAIKARIDKIHAKVNREESVEVKLNHQGQLGWHLRVTRKDEKSIRSDKKYLMLETRKDGYRFTTVDLKNASRDYVDVCTQYSETQAEIVKKALEVIASYTPVIEDANELFSELDVLVGFATVAQAAPEPYVRPTLLPMGAGRIELMGARHPCLEAQDSVAFIANDVKMVRGESNMQIITGPNMGGKSTYIRSVGVIALMAQIGCFVPCHTATLSLVDCVLARVGAGDSTYAQHHPACFLCLAHFTCVCSCMCLCLCLRSRRSVVRCVFVCMLL